MERRDFLKASCSLCAALGAGLIVESLSSCTPLIYSTEVKDNKIEVPVSIFEKANLKVIRCPELAYNVALRKEKDNSYTALYLKCTHAANPLFSTGNGFVCSLHGSTFNKEGIVTKGPAVNPLRKFPVTVIAESIVINLG